MKRYLLFAMLWTAVAVHATTGPTEPAGPLRLTVEENRVTARVVDGSVVEIAEELGRRLGFEVIAQGVSDARVTLDFVGFSPSEAIRAICKGVGYVEVPDAETGKTTRLVLTPGRNGTKNRLSERREPLPPRPEPPVDPTPPPDPPDPPGDKPSRPPDEDDVGGAV